MNTPSRYFDFENIESQVYKRIFYKSDAEFERVRSLCLEEDNWLRDNYTKENLVIEDHSGYIVVYDLATDRPLAMGGLFNDGRWPPNVARMLNRSYIFPDRRNRSTAELINALELVHKWVVLPLIELNNYDAYFITMQNREKKTSKRWWDIMRHTLNASSNNFWTEADNYIQTCPSQCQSCWQNYIYHEIVPGSFQLPVIAHDQWNQLPE
jgi:hypothetical protein